MKHRFEDIKTYFKFDSAVLGWANYVIFMTFICKNKSEKNEKIDHRALSTASGKEQGSIHVKYNNNINLIEEQFPLLIHPLVSLCTLYVQLLEVKINLRNLLLGDGPKL